MRFSRASCTNPYVKTPSLFRVYVLKFNYAINGMVTFVQVVKLNIYAGSTHYYFILRFVKVCAVSGVNCMSERAAQRRFAKVNNGIG